jgi:hypothetical protein
MNTAQQMDTMTGQSDRQDAMAGDDSGDPGYDSGKITLDKSVPEIADAFEGCKPGDMYKVASDDDNELVLEKQPSADDETPPEEPADEPSNDDAGMPKSDNPAIAIIMAKKNKQ